MASRFIALMVLLPCSAALATPLSPADKATIITGTNDSCLENQARIEANKTMLISQLQNYCDCYAKAFSEILQAEDIEQNKDGLTPAITKKAGEVSQKCAVAAVKK
jgi:hypothetical protein